MSGDTVTSHVAKSFPRPFRVRYEYARQAHKYFARAYAQATLYYRARNPRPARATPARPMTASSTPMLVLLALGGLHAAAAPRATNLLDPPSPRSLRDRAAQKKDFKRSTSHANAWLGDASSGEDETFRRAMHGVHERIFEAMKEKPWALEIAASADAAGAADQREPTGAPVGEPGSYIIKLGLLVAAYLSSAAAFTYCGMVMERTRSNGANKKSDATDFTCSADDLTCPITCEIMRDPVSLESGSTFERSAITEWLRTHSTDPLTNGTLNSKRLFPNTAMRGLAQRFCEDGANGASNRGEAGERSWQVAECLSWDGVCDHTAISMSPPLASPEALTARKQSEGY